MDKYLALLVIVMMLVVYNNKSVNSMNIDTSRPIIFSPAPPSSRFGYSLAFRENGTKKWLLVGAPKANSTYQPSLTEPGVLYKCDTKGRACDQVPLDMRGNKTNNVYKDRKNHQFLGSSISVSPDGSEVATCAPSWVAHLYRLKSPRYLMNGICYLATIVGDVLKVKKISPLLGKNKQTIFKQDSFGRNLSLPFHIFGQAGMAAHFASDGTLVLGSPGVDEWSGATIHYRGKGNVTTLYGPTESELREVEAYIGYALTSGYYFRRSDLWFVAGAPRFSGRGQVLVYTPTTNQMAVEVALEGRKFGSYFGATLCTSDVNQDGHDDLLVGAPFEGKMDQGAVHVFLGSDRGEFEEAPTILQGNFRSEARFGSSIASAGDLNQDGYPDIIVGAPYEDSHTGAVYVYNGGPAGLRAEYSQRISLVETIPSIRTFGFSLVGGLDTDGNGYPDIAVGAYGSDTVVMLRSRPVVDLSVTISTNPSVIPRVGDRNNYCPGWQQQHDLCLQITVHFHYEGHLVPDTIAVNYTLTADILRVVAGTPPRATLHRFGPRSSTHVAPSLQQTIVIAKGNPGLEDVFYLVFRKVPRDILTPVGLELTYELASDDSTELQPLLTGLKLVQKRVEFDKDCGRDERCITDLEANVDLVTPTGTSFLALGDPAHFKLHFKMENNGDPAYVTELVIWYPEQILFVGTSRDEGLDRVTCRRRRDLAQDGGLSQDSSFYTRQAAVLCEVGNPIPANSSRQFRVVFESSNVKNVEDVEFTIFSSTISEDVNKNNNNLTLLVPMNYEYYIDAKGLSSPDQLHVREEYSVNLVHKFDVANRGPGITPETNVQVDIPVSTDQGELLKVKSIQIDLEDVSKQTVQCRRVPTSPHARVGELTLGEAKDAVLDCFHADCQTYTCTVPPLAVEQHATIYVSMDVTMATMVKYEDALEILLITEAFIEPVEENVHGNSSRSIQTTTHLHPRKLPVQLNVSWWICGVAACGGLLIFLIVALVMHKLGFFRRTELEELKKLLDQREQNDDAAFAENAYILDEEEDTRGAGRGLIGSTVTATSCMDDDGYYEEPVIDHIYEEPKFLNGASRYTGPGGPTSLSSVSSVASPSACADERFLLSK